MWKEVKKDKKIIRRNHEERLIFDLRENPHHNLIIFVDFYGTDEHTELSQLMEFLHKLLPNFNLTNISDEDGNKIRISLKN